MTAEMGGSAQAWLDRLRRQYFPPERNHLSAHLTIFHALPAFAEDEVRRRLGELAKEPPPPASIDGLMNLGGGVAYRVVSPNLERIRAGLQDAFHGLLAFQDQSGWRPHVTIQNKVSAAMARETLEKLSAEFSPVGLPVAGLGLHRYLGGPWETVANYAFRGPT